MNTIRVLKVKRNYLSTTLKGVLINAFSLPEKGVQFWLKGLKRTLCVL